MIELKNIKADKIIYHKTYELIKLFDSKLLLCITMNITFSVACKCFDKNKTVAFFCSCSKDVKNICKERFFITSTHMKIYKTEKNYFFSTANLSLSMWDEITLVFKITEDLNKFVNQVIKKLKLRKEFVFKYH